VSAPGAVFHSPGNQDRVGGAGAGPEEGGPIARLIGANMNVTTDQPFVWLIPTPTLWVPRRIVARAASTSLTLAAGGIYSAASKGGTAMVAAAQLYAALTGPTLFLDLTIAAAVLSGQAVLTTTPILSLTTAQGGAATANFYLFGDVYG
jgi:hypothetical protein